METTHVITFFFGTTGSIKQYWNENNMKKLKAFDKKNTISSIAKEIGHDMGASSTLVERV